LFARVTGDISNLFNWNGSLKFVRAFLSFGAAVPHGQRDIILAGILGEGVQGERQ